MHRLRGTGGDLVILEEAAFIDESVFNEVVIPLLEVSNTNDKIYFNLFISFVSCILKLQPNSPPILSSL